MAGISDFEIASITIEAFINDAEARNAAEAWYFQGNLVHLDYHASDQPYVLIGRVVHEVPPGATLTDW